MTEGGAAPPSPLLTAIRGWKTIAPVNVRRRAKIVGSLIVGLALLFLGAILAFFSGLALLLAAWDKPEDSNEVAAYVMFIGALLIGVLFLVGAWWIFKKSVLGPQDAPSRPAGDS
jgi:hypothetical protein